MFWLRYVPHAKVEAYQRAGWRLVSRLAGSTHGVWSCLMRFDGEAEPGEPQ